MELPHSLKIEGVIMTTNHFKEVQDQISPVFYNAMKLGLDISKDLQVYIKHCEIINTNLPYLTESLEEINYTQYVSILCLS